MDGAMQLAEPSDEKEFVLQDQERVLQRVEPEVCNNKSQSHQAGST
jgi:hypothetical protein